MVYIFRPLARRPYLFAMMATAVAVACMVTNGDVNGQIGITGVSWTHAVSSELVRWHRLADALGPQSNTTWGRSGACDGAFSVPAGQGPIITWGPDCGDPLPPPPPPPLSQRYWQPQREQPGPLLQPEAGRQLYKWPLDFPRVAIARPADPSSPLLSAWIPGVPMWMGVPVEFEAGRVRSG
jgi:hypothetical protein